MAYWKKQATKARSFFRRNVVQKAKRRYTNSRGNVRLGKIVRDVQYIKSSLNTERKHIDFHITNLVNTRNTPESNLNLRYQRAGPASPNRTTPVIYRLALPQRGTAYNERIGNQIKITNIHGKFQIERFNKQNYQSTCQWKFFIFFVKAGDEFEPTIDHLFEQDSNGNYTPMCRTNAQDFKKFYRPKMLSKSGKIVENISATSSGSTHFKYVNMSQKMNQRIMFTNQTYDKMNDLDPQPTNDPDQFPNCESMRPYICFLSDDNSGGLDFMGTQDQDLIDFTGTIRMSYVDN